MKFKLFQIKNQNFEGKNYEVPITNIKIIFLILISHKIISFHNLSLLFLINIKYHIQENIEKDIDHDYSF